MIFKSLVGLSAPGGRRVLGVLLGCSLYGLSLLLSSGRRVRVLFLLRGDRLGPCSLNLLQLFPLARRLPRCHQLDPNCPWGIGTLIAAPAWNFNQIVTFTGTRANQANCVKIYVLPSPFVVTPIDLSSCGLPTISSQGGV